MSQDAGRTWCREDQDVLGPLADSEGPDYARSPPWQGCIFSPDAVGMGVHRLLRVRP